MPPRSRRPTGASPRARRRGERWRAGKELRRRVRRSAQAAWEPPADRPDPIGLLTTADRGRVRELLPIRYGRMAASPFGFLRGSAPVMAHDLAGTPSTGLRVQLVGDAHLSNFGLFATPERDRVFDANDFDETLAGPWEWDVKRLVTSVSVVGRQGGFPPHRVQPAAAAAVRAYRQRMRSYARQRYLDVWYTHLDLQEATAEVGRAATRLLARELPEATLRTGFHAFPHLAHAGRGGARIRDIPPLLRHYRDPEEEAAVRDVFRAYRERLGPEHRPLFDRYRLVDVAQKVVGVGSVGTRCAVGLFLADDDVPEPLFLQVKEALPSVYEPYVGPSPYANHAERVVVGQRLVQEASDIFLGWSSAGSHDFYVRQLRDMKLVVDVAALRPASLAGYAELCGVALARAHARTGDAAAIAGYLGSGASFDRAVVEFGERYARQVEHDHAALVEAVRHGRLEAVPPGRP